MDLREFRPVLAAVVACLTFIPVAGGQTIWYVDAANCPGPGSGSPDDPFCEIQPAIDAAAAHASPPDEIVMADGVYTGAGNKNLNFGGKAIKLRSAGGPRSCIIDCEASGRGFYFHSDESAASTVEGITVRNGLADDSSPAGPKGGGVYCSASSPTLSNCVVSGNVAATVAYVGAFGGGLFCAGGSPALINCAISGNTTTSPSLSEAGGSGVACSNSCSLTLAGCRIEENRSTGQGQAAGGGVFCTSASSVTLIDCEILANAAGAGGGVECYDATGTLNDCMIANNTAGAGGGICCNGSSMTITDCMITHNSGVGGGGVYSFWYSALVLQGCTIAENTSSFGGGVYCIYYDDTRLTDCVISSNTAVESGGGVNCVQSSPRLNRCIISGNTVAGSSEATGGGVFCDWDSWPTFVDSVISGNAVSGASSAAGGGGVCSSQAGPTFINCAIRGNRALSGCRGGGVLCRFNSYPSFVSCSISSNTARRGGGVYCDNDSDPVLTNCTISGNIADQGGGFYGYGSHAVLTNCIFWGDSPQEIQVDFSESNVTYCDVQGGWWTGVGNIDADPLFVRSPSPGSDGLWGTEDDDYGDLRLSAGSPCIDAGENAAIPEDVTTDMAGNPRVADGTCDCTPIVDMGAYEYRQDCLPGDMTGDGRVDEADYWYVHDGLGHCAPEEAYEEHVLADLDRDACITLVDYQAWLSCYQAATGEQFVAPAALPDAAVVVDAMLGLDSDPAHRAASDLNGDGAVDGRDVQSLVNALVGR